MQTITRFPGFNDRAAAAMNFHTAIFRNPKTGRIRRFGAAGPGPDGAVASAAFEPNGQAFIAPNGDLLFPFTPAGSFFVDCETRGPLDRLEASLAPGGRA